MSKEYKCSEGHTVFKGITSESCYKCWVLGTGHYAKPTKCEYCWFVVCCCEPSL